MVDNDSPSGGDQVQGDEEEAKQELKEPVTGSQEKGLPDVASPVTEPLSPSLAQRLAHYSCLCCSCVSMALWCS